MTTAAETGRVGSVVGGKYRLVRRLASGGMGVVFEAQHTLVGRRFAVKLLRRELAQRRDILARFQREAAAAGALESENVAAVLDLGIADDGTPYMVMEYLAGESLAALLAREGRLPVGRAADLVAQACRGIGAAHAARIIHRDLKPQNLFVSRREDGTDLLKVLDFGVAKLRDADDAIAETRTGTVIGTAAYMAPEQARGDQSIDHRADVYAIGTILYELLSGRRPHPGESQNAVLHHIATQPAVPLVSVAPEVPAGLVDVVERTLALAPDDRPSSAAALADQLAPFAERVVWPPPPETPAEPPTDGGPPPRPPRPPRRAWRWMVPAALIAALAVGLAVASKRRPSPPQGQASLAATVRRPPPPLDRNTRFLSTEAPPGATAQIEALLKQGATRDAALISAMIATPTGIWFLGGTPEQVRRDASDAVARGGRQGRVPILVTYNHPFHDCTGYGVSGAADTAAYLAWIGAFAAGIGNEKALVILEPNSLGLIPYGKRLDGSEDPCKPTDAAADGTRVTSPGATPVDRFAALAGAIAELAAHAPNARVYLDGTHSSWHNPGEIAYRLHRAGVERTNGFFLNVGNYQPTHRQVQYGNWIAKCLAYARSSPLGPDSPVPYRECHGQSDWMDPANDAAWAAVEAWYVQEVDHGPHPPTGAELTHFVINTNRNGRGPLQPAVYARAPYHQPPAVIAALQAGSWCMPPDRGLGYRPTADTGIPLADAFLWTDEPGTTVAACDIAGGARAWDYDRYNPWGIEGDAQNHFDPLWGQVLPPSGAWFPACALELARNAEPPLRP
jgi:endoglucanase